MKKRKIVTVAEKLIKLDLSDEEIESLGRPYKRKEDALSDHYIDSLRYSFMKVKESRFNKIKGMLLKTLKYWWIFLIGLLIKLIIILVK